MSESRSTWLICGCKVRDGDFRKDIWESILVLILSILLPKYWYYIDTYFLQYFPSLDTGNFLHVIIHSRKDESSILSLLSPVTIIQTYIQTHERICTQFCSQDMLNITHTTPSFYLYFTLDQLLSAVYWSLYTLDEPKQVHSQTSTLRLHLR